MRVILSVSMWLYVSSPALASDLSSRLEQASSEMDADGYRSAKKTLDAAEKSVPLSSEAVTNAELSRLFFDRGVLERLRGDTRGRTMAAWRRALIVNPDLEWDSRYLGEGDDWSLFEALRSEVGTYPMVGLSIPPQQGAAILYVDGNVVRPGDSVIQGRHLAQIQCDDGIVRGAWTEFQGPFDWFALCPGGVDATVVLTESSGADDEWSEFGPVFGTPVNTEPVVVEEHPEGETGAGESPPSDEGGVTEGDGVTDAPEVEEIPGVAPDSAPTLDVESDATESTSTDLPVTEINQVVEATEAPRPEDEQLVTDARSLSGWMEALPVDSKQILSGGGALLVTGMVVNFTVVNSTWAEIDAARNAPETVSRDEADALTLRFNRGRTAVFFLGGGGIALLGLGGAAWIQEQGTIRVGNLVLQPQMNPSSVGVQIAF